MVELELRMSRHRHAVADALRDAVPDLRDVGVHVGAFGIETLERFSMVAPAARVSFVGARNVRRNNVGQLVGPCLYNLFVMAKDPLRGEAYGPALDLAEKCADFIDMNRFGLPYAAAARIHEIEPIYSENLDKLGMGLVAVVFHQEIQIGRSRHDIDEAELYPDWTDPDLVAAGWPQTLNTGASSFVSTPNIFGEVPSPEPDNDGHPQEQQ